MHGSPAALRGRSCAALSLHGIRSSATPYIYIFVCLSPDQSDIYIYIYIYIYRYTSPQRPCIHGGRARHGNTDVTSRWLSAHEYVYFETAMTFFRLSCSGKAGITAHGKYVQSRQIAGKLQTIRPPSSQLAVQSFRPRGPKGGLPILSYPTLPYPILS